jgi:hypothetical protein
MAGSPLHTTEAQKLRVTLGGGIELGPLGL